MSLKGNIIMGAVGAAGIYAVRSMNVPVINPLINGVSRNPIKIPLPNIMPKAAGGFGLQWSLIPAAVGYWLSR